MAAIFRAGFGLLAAATVLSGCAAPQNRASVDIAALLARLTAENDAVMRQMPIDPAPLTGAVLIVVPDVYRLHPFILSMARIQGSGGTLDMQAQILEVELLNTAHAVVHSHTFASSAVRVQNDTLNPSMGGADYLLWFQVRSLQPYNAGPWIGGWYLRGAGSPREERVVFDPGTAPGVPRLESFIQGVHGAAGRLDGPPPGPKSPSEIILFFDRVFAA